MNIWSGSTALVEVRKVKEAAGWIYVATMAWWKGPRRYIDDMTPLSLWAAPSSMSRILLLLLPRKVALRVAAPVYSQVEPSWWRLGRRYCGTQVIKGRSKQDDRVNGTSIDDDDNIIDDQPTLEYAKLKCAMREQEATGLRLKRQKGSSHGGEYVLNHRVKAESCFRKCSKTVIKSEPGPPATTRPCRRDCASSVVNEDATKRCAAHALAVATCAGPVTNDVESKKVSEPEPAVVVQLQQHPQPWPHPPFPIGIHSRTQSREG
jgi:hypothetical protein